MDDDSAIVNDLAACDPEVFSGNSNVGVGWVCGLCGTFLGDAGHGDPKARASDHGTECPWARAVRRRATPKKVAR